MLVLQRALCAGKYIFFAHSHLHGEFLVFAGSEGEEMPEFPFPTKTAHTADPGIRHFVIMLMRKRNGFWPGPLSVWVFSGALALSCPQAAPQTAPPRCGHSPLPSELAWVCAPYSGGGAGQLSPARDPLQSLPPPPS